MLGLLSRGSKNAEFMTLACSWSDRLRISPAFNWLVSSSFLNFIALNRFTSSHHFSGCSPLNWWTCDCRLAHCWQFKWTLIIGIQGHDLYQIKKEEFSGDISKLPLVQWHSLLQLITFYFHWVHWQERIENVRKFVVLQTVRIKMGQGSYLGYWTGQYVMYFFLHSTI